jgi:hypothetical protein
MSMELWGLTKNAGLQNKWDVKMQLTIRNILKMAGFSLNNFKRQYAQLLEDKLIFCMKMLGRKC